MRYFLESFFQSSGSDALLFASLHCSALHALLRRQRRHFAYRHVTLPVRTVRWTYMTSPHRGHLGETRGRPRIFPAIKPPRFRRRRPLPREGEGIGVSGYLPAECETPLKPVDSMRFPAAATPPACLLRQVERAAMCSASPMNHEPQDSLVIGSPCFCKEKMLKNYTFYLTSPLVLCSFYLTKGSRT